MISFILIALSALCNALMDVSQFHYSTSILTKFNKPQYFNGEISWENKYVDWRNGDKRMRKWFFGLFNIPAAFTDFWHIAKSIMIVLFILAIVLYEPVFGILIDFFVLGAIWNLVFLAFYKKILVVRKNKIK
jgi:hypothetical protein